MQWQTEHLPAQILSPARLVGLSAIASKSLDTARVRAAVAMAENFKRFGIQLLFVNGESHPDLPALLEETGAKVVTVGAVGLAAQYLYGMDLIVEQCGTEVAILKTEPEKVEVLPAGFDQIMTALAVYDVTLVGRTLEARASMAPEQQIGEYHIGQRFQAWYGLPTDDAACGILLIGPAALSLFRRCLSDLCAAGGYASAWLYLYILPLLARNEGLRVGSALINLVYPPEIVQEETGNPVFVAKRRQQLGDQLTEMLRRYPIAANAETLVEEALAAYDLEVSRL